LNPPRASNIDLTGTYVPMDGKAPTVFGLVAEGQDFVACFRTMRRLRSFMRRTGVTITGLKFVEDSDEFVERTPEALSILLDPTIDDAGVVRYVLVERLRP